MNILSIHITFEVSKFDKSKETREWHSEKKWPILLSLLVSRFDKLIETKDIQWLKRLFARVKGVFNCDKSISVAFDIPLNPLSKFPLKLSKIIFMVFIS